MDVMLTHGAGGIQSGTGLPAVIVNVSDRAGVAFETYIR